MAHRALVVGASGLVGSFVHQFCEAAGATLGVARSVFGRATQAVDLNDPAPLKLLAEQHRPDIVYVCSAWPHVDGCERDPSRSFRENVQTVINLIDAVPTSTRVVFFSTDHVFDGTRSAYEVDAPRSPLSVYARHKADVETALLQRGNALVIRTSYVFGPELRKKNFVYRVIESCQRQTTLSVPALQGGMPTSAPWLAQTAVQLASTGTTGVVHLVGPEWLTKHDWAQRIATSLQLPSLKCIETTAAEAGQVAPRPNRVFLTVSPTPTPHPALSHVLSLQRPYFNVETSQ
jgi:dTDP-4-dehydrorhamnose reductase